MATTRRKTMSKLTYWTIQHQTDADCYSPIAKTKNELYKLLLDLDVDLEDFRKPDGTFQVEKRIITYEGAFDLFDQVTDEGGGRSSAGILSIAYPTDLQTLKDRITYANRFRLSNTKQYNTHHEQKPGRD
jgi:hypothetical protein